jgi:pimeloyl-[acyl-carrier protein] methyl ester esterase
MQFFTQGAGRPPLIVIHGWAMHGGVFARLASCLESHFTVHTFDLPGHGRSVNQPFVLPDVIAEIAAYLTDLAPATLVGWSLGGAIAAALALDFPNLIRAVVPIASSPCFVSKPDWQYSMAPSALKSFADALAEDWEAVVDRFLALETLGSPNEKSELRWLRAEVYAHGKPDPAALMSGLAMLESIDLRARFADLRVPSLWLGGRRDRIVPPQAILAAAVLCRGRAELLATAHAPFLTHPEQVANFIVEFAAGQ